MKLLLIEGKADIAYQLLCSVARSHKSYINKANDITSVYLITTNTDASPDNISLHLFERGFFGWQIGLMLNLVYDTKDWRLEDKTAMIKKVNSRISHQSHLIVSLNMFIQGIQKPSLC